LEKSDTTRGGGFVEGSGSVNRCAILWIEDDKIARMVLLRTHFYCLPVGLVSLLATGCYHSITAGSSHVCVLKGSDPYCLGTDPVGRFGNGVNGATGSSGLVRAASGMKFGSIGAGDSNTCGVNDKGAYCWGENSLGQSGLAALGTTPTLTAPPKDPVTPTGGGGRFVRISTGDTGTCALTDAGKLYCWGDNGNGQIGQGTYGPGSGYQGERCFSGRPCFLSPQEVPAPKGAAAFATISARQGTRCAVTKDNQLYCWGDPQFRQTGTPDSTPYTDSPTHSRDGMATAVVGAHSTCGLSAKGEALCWGMDDKVGNLGAPATQAVCGSQGLGNPPCSPTPTPVTGNHKFESRDGAVGIEEFTVCALDKKGLAYCWGNNSWGADPNKSHGRLGNDSSVDFSQEPVAVNGPDGKPGDALRFREIAVGSSYVCGIERGRRRIYCWGGDTSGAIYGSHPMLVAGHR